MKRSNGLSLQISRVMGALLIVAMLLAPTQALAATTNSVSPSPQRAQLVDPIVINEFVFNHTGTDNNEYIEVLGLPSSDYTAAALLEIEGDGSGAGTVDGIFPITSTDANGYWQTGFIPNAIENGTVTLLLVDTFTGSPGDDLDTDNDGVLDVTPWTAVVDSVGVSDGDASDWNYTDVVLAPNFDGISFTPGGASRIPDGVDTDTSADWVRNDYDLAGITGFDGSPTAGEAYNTPGLPNMLVPMINEFSASTTGTDVEYVEVLGSPLTDYSDFAIVQLEGDNGSPMGTIDSIDPITDTDAAGYWYTGFYANRYENGSITLLLVSGMTETVGTDLDANDDGVLDYTPWTHLVDGVAVNDGDAGDLTYADVVLTDGYDGLSFPPGGASRIPNGFATNSVSDWTRNDFSLAGIPGYAGSPVYGEAYNTPMAENLAVPVINEFSFSTTGADVEYIEVLGGPQGDYSDFSLLTLEGDSGSTVGTIDTVDPITSTNDAGFWFTGLYSGRYENGSITLLLVKGFTDSVGTDLDTDDDGVLDVTPWASLVDSVAVNDGDTGDLTYADTVLGPNYDGISNFAPGGASRIPDGLDTGTTADWVRNDFDLAGIPGYAGSIDVGEAYNTPLAPNEAYVAPEDLLVSKTGPSGIQPGDDLSYVITIDNTALITATGLILTDTLPAGVTYMADDSGIAPTEIAPGVYVWNLVELAPSVSASINLTATSSATLTVGTVLTNTVQVASDLTGDDLTNNSDSWGTSIVGITPIHDIQYVPDPATSDASPYLDQTVTVEGIVTAEPGELDTGTRLFAIEDPAGGPWSGLYVFSSGGFTGLNAPEGTWVRVTGTVDEYFGLTQLVVPNGAGGVEVLSTGNSVPAPEVIPTGDYVDPATAEQWEGVLIEFQGATVVDDNLGFGEWAFDDGSGATAADDLGNVGDGDLTYDPVNGQVYDFIRGIGYYSFGAYKLAPRYDADIQLYVATPGISKQAPALVAPGGLFTYTIDIQNDFAFALDNLVITDVVPANATFAFAQDGGVETGGVVTWTLPSLAPHTGIQVQFAVTATDQITSITNSDYAVAASTFVTPTYGAPVITYVGNELYIHNIQGAGDVSPLVGSAVDNVDGVVTDLMNNGFFMQEPESEADANPDTSEGIFVYTGSAPTVQVGEGVTVTGSVSEYQMQTEINSTGIVTFTTTESISPTLVDLPSPAGVWLEPVEGMLVTIPETLTATGNYFLGRYGQVMLSSDGRMYQPNNGNGFGDTFELDMRRLIVLDDNTTSQNPTPVPYLGADNTLRTGDTVTGLTGVVDSGFINSNEGAWYRLQPTEPVNFTRANQRTEAPEPVGGNLKVASFNVLNYFNGPDFPTSRGADTFEEFQRQRTKIITALLSIDADIVGLMEIENDGDGPDSAIADLVDGLNAEAGPGTYDYVMDPPVIGTDEIKVAMIYKPGSVTPFGDSKSDPDPVHNRPPVAQTFTNNATGGTLSVVVNHFKSKGSCPPPGDPNADQGDGQGCWNLLRVQQAEALLDFINQIQAETNDADVLVIGDLNSYGEEDPIVTLTNGGLVNLPAQFVPAADRYSYQFDGMFGYLDHALATAHLAQQVTDATYWHINSDEPAVLDYNTEFNPPELYEPTAYRSSDHDPVLVGLQLAPTQIGFEAGSYEVMEGGTAELTVALDSVSAITVTVDYSSMDITAIAGSDYTPISGTLTFAPGVITQTISLETLQDNDLLEDTETLSVSLSNPSLGEIAATGQATVSILNQAFTIYLPWVPKDYAP